MVRDSVAVGVAVELGVAVKVRVAVKLGVGEAEAVAVRVAVRVGLAVRAFDPGVREMLKARLHEIVAGHAGAYGVTAKVDYDWGYPATVNHAEEADFAAGVAAEIVGETAVDARSQREMGSEDFSYMLQARPGAYLFLGTGPGAGLHHPEFELNDEAEPIGASFFARLVERAQPL